MNKENKKTTRKLPVNKEEEKRDKKKKTTKKQNNISLDYEIEENKIDEIDHKIHKQIKNLSPKFFSKIKPDLLGYYSSFICIEDMFSIVKLNQKFKRCILREPSIFKKFLNMRKIEKYYESHEINIYDRKGEDILVFINSQKLIEYFREDQSESVIHILETFLSYSNNSHYLFKIEEPKIQFLFLIKLMVNSKFYPKSSKLFPITNLNLCYIKNINKFDELEYFEIREMICEIINKSKLTSLNFGSVRSEIFLPIFSELEKNKNITNLGLVIDFSSEEYFHEGFPIIIDNLKNNKTITKLNFRIDSYWKETSQDFNLNNFISSNIKIKDFTLAYYGDIKKNYLFNTEDLFNSIKNNKNLEVLRLSGFLNQTGLEIILNILDKKKTGKSKNKNGVLQSYPFSNIKTLELYKGDLIHKNCFKVLGKIINKMTNLKKFDLSYNKIDYYLSAPLFKALEKNTSIETLIIRKGDIKAGVFKKIIELLKVNDTLKKVDLSNNMIEFLDNSNIKAMLEVNTTLRDLNLLHNRVIGVKEQEIYKILADRLNSNEEIAPLN